MSGPGVERLGTDIDRTRMEMIATIEAIGDRLDPVHLVSGAKQTVRAATVGRVEEMANDAADMATRVAHDASGSARRAGGGLVDTIRRNPVPAAMALIGVGWLMASRGSSSAGTAERGRGDPRRRAGDVRFASGYADPRRDVAADPLGGRPTGELYAGAGHDDRGGFDTGEEPGDRLGDRFDELAGRVEAAGGTPDQLGRAPDRVTGGVRDASWAVQRTLEDNPLGAGAIAVAVGTAIGLALPPSEAERRVLGDAGARAVGRAGAAATDAMRRLEDRAVEAAERSVGTEERDDEAAEHAVQASATASASRSASRTSTAREPSSTAGSDSVPEGTGPARAAGSRGSATASESGRKRSR